jgi:hypothetical protein
MKLYILIAVMFAVKCQNRVNEEIRRGIDVDVKTEIDIANNNVETVLFEEEKKRVMEEFMNQAITDLNEFKNTTKTVEVGEFVILIQTACQLEEPQPPVVDPIELECLEGHVQGELVAKAIATLSKETPLPVNYIMGHMAECSLLVKKNISFTIFNNCFNLEFNHYYQKYLEDLVRRMRLEGFEYTTDGNGGYTFTKAIEQDSIDLISQQTEVVPTLRR